MRSGIALFHLRSNETTSATMAPARWSPKALPTNVASEVVQAAAASTPACPHAAATIAETDATPARNDAMKRKAPRADLPSAWRHPCIRTVAASVAAKGRYPLPDTLPGRNARAGARRLHTAFSAS